MLITFDGVDGAGKSSYASWLAGRLKEEGYSIMLTREPGGTNIGQAIRALLLDVAHTDMGIRTELLLYAADRAQHVHTRIIPALNEGRIVISDRFSDATLVYQANCGALDEGVVGTINTFATQGLVPVRTYICDVPIAVSEQRMRQRSKEKNTTLDRIEQRDVSYFAKVRAGFLRLAQREAHRCVVIDCNRPIKEVQSLIWSDVVQLLGTR